MRIGTTSLTVLLLLLPGCASQPDARVGVLSAGDPTIAASMVETLAAEGWVAGDNLVIVSPEWESVDDLPMAIDQLVDADVDLVVGVGAPPSRAFATLAGELEIPLVALALENNSDALDLPWVTGLLGSNAPGRRVELASLALDIERVMVPVLDDDAAQSNFTLILDELDALGVEVLRVDFDEPADFALAVERGPSADAVLPAASSAVTNHYEEAIAAATERGMPFLSGVHRSEMGAFLSYGWQNEALGSDIAYWVVELLEGTPVDELDFGSFRLTLALNLDTAETLGIEVPPALVEQAERTYP